MGLFNLTKTYTGNTVPKANKWLFPLMGLFRDAFTILVSSFLLQYAISSGVLSADPETFKAQYGVITIAMIIALIWDGLNDPIMGILVEKFKFKLGKFKPWLLIGAIGDIVATLCLFLIRPTMVVDGVAVANGWGFVGLMIGFYFLWDLFFTMNDIGYWAMLPSLTNNEQERTKLTTKVALWSSAGGFLMTASCFLLPTMFSGLSSANIYALLAIVSAILFLISQLSIVLFCKEHKRVNELAEEKTSIKDLFVVFAKNKPARTSIIALFIYHLTISAITGGILLNYFYLSIGYGGGRGGLVSTIMSIMYVLATIVAQIVYPKLSKKLSKQKILTIATIIQLIGFAGFGICCLPLFGNTPIAHSAAVLPEMSSFDLGWAFSGTMSLYYILSLIFFFGFGLTYTVLLIMLQNSIDYNEYKFKDRKEAVISAWRPFTVKLSSAALKGVQFLIFLCAGLLSAINGISTAEAAHNAAVQGQPVTWVDTDFINTINSIQASVTVEQLRIAGIMLLAVLAVSTIATWILIHFGYKLSEKEHAKIVQSLEDRRPKE